MKKAAAAVRPGAPALVAGHRLEPGSIPLLVTLGLGVFAGALDLSVLSPALPALTAEFGIGAGDASLAVSIYLLANIACIPIAAKLADRYGRRPLYIACVGIFAAGSLVSICSPNYGIFLLGRAIQAAGAGGIFPVATATIADRIPPERRGGALGILGAIWGLAGIMGPIVGGILTAVLSWRWIFILNLPLAALVILLAQQFVPVNAPARKGPLDVLGLSCLCLGLTALMAALLHLDPSQTERGTPLEAAGAALTAVAAFAGLYFAERRAAEPVVSPKLIGNRQIALTYFIELFIGAIEGSLFFMPAALKAGQHLNAAWTGIISSLGAVLFVAIIPVAGRALDRIGARAVLAAGAATSAAGLALFAIGYTSLPLSLAAIVVSGAGFGALLGAPTRYILTQEAPADMRSTAIGLLSSFLIMGQLIGASLAGGLIGTHALDQSPYTTLYLSFAALGLVTLVLTRALAGPKPRPQSS